MCVHLFIFSKNIINDRFYKGQRGNLKFYCAGHNNIVLVHFILMCACRYDSCMNQCKRIFKENSIFMEVIFVFQQEHIEANTLSNRNIEVYTLHV